MGNVIKGWDEGLVGRCVKDKVRLTIPPELGYGDEGAGHKDHEDTEEAEDGEENDEEEVFEDEYVVPPGATLVFDITIVDVEEGDNAEPGFIKL